MTSLQPQQGDRMIIEIGFVPSSQHTDDITAVIEDVEEWIADHGHAFVYGGAHDHVGWPAAWDEAQQEVERLRLALEVGEIAAQSRRAEVERLREATNGLLRVIDGKVSESDAQTDIAFARQAVAQQQIQQHPNPPEEAS